MSAPNFYSTSGKYFVIGEYEWWEDDLIDWILSELRKMGLKPEFVNEWNRNRNYPARYFGEITEDEWVWVEEDEQNHELGWRLKLLMRCGYYDGYNLDYEIEWYSNPDWKFDLNENDIEEVYGKEVLDKLLKKLEDTIQKVEKVYRKVCDVELGLIGIFSNGEAIYKEI